MSTPYGSGGDPQQQWPPQQPGPGYGPPGPPQDTPYGGGYGPQPGQPYGPPPGQPGQPGQPHYGPPGQQQGHPLFAPQPGQQPYGQPGHPGQPGQPGQQYPGQYTPPGGYPTGQPPAKKSAMPWILLVVGIVVIAGAVVGVLFVLGVFGGKTFDNAAVQDGVHKVLTEDYGESNVTEVTCPSGQKVEAGHTFTCTATIDGEDRSVQITVKTDEGEYEVGQPG